MTDPILASLVSATNQGGLSDLRVTLVVGGQTLGGTLISHAAWFRLFTSGLADLPGTEEGEIELLELGDEAEALSPDSPDYLHLSDVTLYSGGGMTNFAGAGYWRGRLDAVTVWTLGAPS